MDSRDIINLQEAYLEIYAPQELTEEEKIAAEYFYEQGLNDDGVAILIEELGIDEFNEWVSEIVEDYNLTEWRRGAGGTRVRGSGMSKSGKSIGDLKGGAKTSAIRATPEHKARKAERESTSSSSGMRDALRSQAATAAASKQKPTPKSETPSQTKGGISGLLQKIGDRAKADTKKLTDTWQTASNTPAAGLVRGAMVAGSKAIEKHGPEVGRRAGRAAGTAVGATLRAGQRFGRSEAGQRLKKSLGKVVFKDEYEAVISYLIDEGYAKTVDSAERIMESMSEEWQDQILNEMPFQIYTYKNGQRVNVGKPYNFDPNNPESKKNARRRVRRRINNLDQDAGGYTHGYHETP